MDPVKYPTINISGEDIEVKFRQCDILAMAKAGHDMFAVRDPSSPAHAFPVAAMIERNLNWLRFGLMHHKTFSVDDLATLLDLAQFGEVDRIIAESIKKASAQIVKALQGDATIPAPETQVQ